MIHRSTRIFPSPSKDDQFDGGQLEHMLKTYTEQLKRPLSQFETLSSDTHRSIFEGLSLSDYVYVRSFVCNRNHKKPCDVCTRMIWVAKTISAEGFL